MAYPMVLQALADPTRRQIFETLVARPRNVREVADGLTVSRPAVSQHLRVLRDAGLVTEQREGTRRIHRADPAGLSELRAYVERMWVDEGWAQLFRAVRRRGRDALERLTE